MLWNTSSVPQLNTFSENQKEGSDQINPGMAAAVEVIFCQLSFTVAHFSSVALVSFFLTTLPSQRNLLTFFDIVLVVALTSVVDITVRITSFGAVPGDLSSSYFLLVFIL